MSLVACANSQQERREYCSAVGLLRHRADPFQPAAMMISFTIAGLAAYLVLSALGEVASWLPKPCTVADQADRFSDPALGFSLAWMCVLSSILLRLD